MFFANTERLEVTTDKDNANMYLNDGWLLLRIMSTGDNFAFVLGKVNRSRVSEILGLEDDSMLRKRNCLE